MRFETDVLRYTRCPYGCCMSYVNGNNIDNTACRREIVKAGWVMPSTRGASIILVFSTTCVAGASQCLVRHLNYAGLKALKASAPTRLPARNDTLWWWPEIVTGDE